MVKVSGNLSELVGKLETNKRDKVVDTRPVAKTAEKVQPKASSKKGAPARSKRQPGVIYRSMKLDIPEDLKKEVDLMFLNNRHLQELGKNNWLIEAVKDKLGTK